MTFSPNIHHRKSIRLRGYDYSRAGLYFITICTHERLPLFGEIVDRKMIANEAGVMVETCWRAIPNHFPWAMLHEFMVMPNHVHGIIAIGTNNAADNMAAPSADDVGGTVVNDVGTTAPDDAGSTTVNDVGAKNFLPPHHLPLQRNAASLPKHGTSRTIGSIVRGFKVGVTKWFRVNTDVHVVWQRNYHEHIIRNEDSYLKIAEYIQTNPQKWQEDIYYV